jgi:hypothetical protein
MLEKTWMCLWRYLNVKSPVYVCWRFGCDGRNVLHLSNIINDVVLIWMTYCASVLLYEFILSSEFSTAWFFIHLQFLQHRLIITMAEICRCQTLVVWCMTPLRQVAVPLGMRPVIHHHHLLLHHTRQNNSSHSSLEVSETWRTCSRIWRLHCAILRTTPAVG